MSAQQVAVAFEITATVNEASGPSDASNEANCFIIDGQVIRPVPEDSYCDRALLPEMFKAIEQDLGVCFTFDAASNDDGTNAHCARYACNSRSFFDSDVSGETVWINPPYTHVKEWQYHYAKCKKKNPENTSAMFCVPAWPGVNKIMQKAGYRLHNTFPKGSVLFSQPDGKGGREVMGQTPWPVQLWWDPPAQPVCLNATSAHGHTMVFDARLERAPCVVLMDSGAKCGGIAHGFISRAAVERANVPMRDAALNSVKVAGGSTAPLVGAVRTTLKFGSHREDVHLLVLDNPVPGADVILADEWFLRRSATMSWDKRNCSLSFKDVKGQQVVLHPKGARGKPNELPSGEAVMDYVMFRLLDHFMVHSMTARHAAKRLGHGARAVLTFVQPDFPAHSQTPPPADTQPSAEGLMPQDALDSLIDEFKEVFEEPTLPPERPYLEGHTIPTVEGASPPAKRSYRLTQKEQEEVHKQVTDLLAKGFIEPSTSPYGAPVIFVEKADGSLRMVLDFRALNKITLKRKYPMPNITELFDRLAGASVFSSLDLQQGYNQIRIAPSDIAKTGFIAPGMGQFEWKVLCFGLTNAPATFQAAMNTIFGTYINKFVLVYLDDILVFSRNADEHESHLRKVLEVLQQHKFKAKRSKCHFNQPELHFLGHVVSRTGLKVDNRKVQVIRDWPVPTDLPKLRAFLGLANYFRRFIQGYSSLVAPLTSLTRTTNEWKWDNACQVAFDGVKTALTNAPVLKLPDLDKAFTVISDASVHGTGAVLLQDERPVAYTSSKFSKAEYNYTTTDQECLGTVRAMEEWRCYLEGAADVLLVTDHQPLTYLMDQQKADMINRRQARWLERLSRFNFTYKYIQGRLNVADPISRVHEAICATLCATMTANGLSGRIKAAYALDENLADAEWVKKHKLRFTKGYWWRGPCTYVPDQSDLRKELLTEFHDAPYSGHRGRDRTLYAISQKFWWPGLAASVASHVTSCPCCQRNKPTNAKPGGMLQPLPIPPNVWDSVSMDLITQLPLTPDGHDAIVVFVDRLSKMTHFAPTTTTVNSEGLAALFVANVFRLHGLPVDIVSDRDTRITSTFWREVQRLLGTKLHLSSAYHPESDGQTERMNRVLEEALRHYIAPNHRDWDTHLPVLEFAVNSSWQRSTGATPFSLNGVKDPRLPVDLGLTSKAPSAEQFVSTMRERIAKAKQLLLDAQTRTKADADAHRRPVEFQVGQDVLLSTRNLRQTEGTKKLAPRYVGPYKIESLVGKAAVKLTLPPRSRLHPVFHVSLIKPFKPDSRAAPATPELPMEGGDAYQSVEAIIAHRDPRVRGGSGKTRREYLVKWAGIDHSHNTWETEKSLWEASLEEEIAGYENTLAPSQQRPPLPPHMRPVSDDLACEVCTKTDNGPNMVICSKCRTGWHTTCLRPELKEVPKGRWHCPNCYVAKPVRPVTAPTRASTRLATKTQ